MSTVAIGGRQNGMPCAASASGNAKGSARSDRSTLITPLRSPMIRVVARVRDGVARSSDRRPADA